MPRAVFMVLTLSAVVFVPSLQAQPQDQYYIFNGTTLETTNRRPLSGTYTRWQVWLFQAGVHIPRYTAGLQYSRWGAIEGSSGENVMTQLRDWQSFEQAYVRFFGSGTWGRYTFLNPIGPIAVDRQAPKDQLPALETQYQLRWLQERTNKLINTVRPSLENNDSESPDSPVKGYLDQIRNLVRRVSRITSQWSRAPSQLRPIETGIAQARTELAQAEDSVAKITSILPSVRLPASKAWMSHAQRAGSDGTIQVEVIETGSGILVEQTWSGGDGSMAGTVIITTIPYKDIGTVQSSTRNGDDRWAVRLESATVPFPQTIDSPQRITSRRSFRAVHLSTTESWFYFIFPNSAEAQDCYAYFLYHKQLGR